MSTRGFIGFVADGKTFVTYNHSDSYPDSLGADMLKWLRGADLNEASVLASRLRIAEGEPTDEDIERLAAFYDGSVGGRSERPTWYQLLRETQGNPVRILAAGVIEDASEFPGDSLFAEYGYVVDFDTKVFEGYVGFQRASHEKGRFHAVPRENPEYAPVALAGSWPLDALPTDDEFDNAFHDGNDA